MESTFRVSRISFGERSLRLPITFAILCLAMMGGQALAQPASSDITGTWQTEDGRAKIRTEKCGEGNADLCGYVVWLKDPLTDKGQPRTDVKNPDPAQRGRPSLGMEIMVALKPDDKTHYAGEIYNADDGKKYNVTVGMEKAEQLEVRGCLMRILCGSQTWQRVADLPLPTAKLVATKAVKPSTSAGAHPHESQSAQ